MTINTKLTTHSCGLAQCFHATKQLADLHREDHAKGIYRFSSVQINLSPDLAKMVTDYSGALPADSFAGKGAETNPHLTVRYGLHTTDADAVAQVISPTLAFAVNFGANSFFTGSDSSDGADVVKVDVESDDLRSLNQLLGDSFEHTDTHAEYHPHVTIAYVKNGMGELCSLGSCLQGKSMMVESVVFSDPDGNQQEIRLSDLKTAQKGKAVAKAKSDQQSNASVIKNFMAKINAKSPASGIEDLLVAYGDEIKVGSNGQVSGYLVRFGSASDTDITQLKDYFTAQTYFGDHKSTDIYYNHGDDPVLGRRVIGKGEMKVDDVGVWLDGILYQRDAYERGLAKLAQQKKLGWSSGTAGHLVERKDVGESHEITRWPLGLDASVTPTPAEPRNSVMSAKSLAASTPTLTSLLTDELDQARKSLFEQRLWQQMNKSPQDLTDDLLAVAEEIQMFRNAAAASGNNFEMEAECELRMAGYEFLDRFIATIMGAGPAASFGSINADDATKTAKADEDAEPGDPENDDPGVHDKTKADEDAEEDDPENDDPGERDQASKDGDEDEEMADKMSSADAETLIPEDDKVRPLRKSIDALIAAKNQSPLAGLTYADHSRLVLAAADEVTKAAQFTCGELETLTERRSQITKTRIAEAKSNRKAGRKIGSKTRAMITTAKEHVSGMKDSLMSVCEKMDTCSSTLDEILTLDDKAPSDSAEDTGFDPQAALLQLDAELMAVDALHI